MFSNLTFNSVMWMLIGVALFAVSFWEFRTMRLYTMTVGIICIGIGCILCGITNGFSLFTPAGAIMRKLGILAFLLGLPVTGYYVYLYFLR